MPLDLDKGGRRPQVIQTYLGPTSGWKNTDAPTYIEYVVGGGGDAVGAGYVGGLIIPDWLTPIQWVLTSPVAGSAEVDLWRVPITDYIAGTVPSVANSICNGVYPTLTNDTAATGIIDEDWTQPIDQNDFIGFNIRSVSTVNLLGIYILCIRNIGPS